MQDFLDFELYRQNAKRKKMKVRFNRWYNAVLTTLLSMLGYGCSFEEPMDMYGTAVMEYGVPNADYIVMGQVTDETGTPVQGIKTSLKIVYQDENDEYFAAGDASFNIFSEKLVRSKSQCQCDHNNGEIYDHLVARHSVGGGQSQSLRPGQAHDADIEEH